MEQGCSYYKLPISLNFLFITTLGHSTAFVENPVENYLK